jgi:hypothetical protein
VLIVKQVVLGKKPKADPSRVRARVVVVPNGGWSLKQPLRLAFERGRGGGGVERGGR